MAGPCDPPNNEIVCENSKQGNPPSEWELEGAGDPSIQGFATDISVNQGDTVHFKIKTPATAYHLDIYRLGYYGGDGARKVAANVAPTATLPQIQSACDEEPSSGLIDCGNWAESASWQVPSDAVSGLYFAKLTRDDQSSGWSQVLFIVRDDDGESDLLFQTSDTTWEAYNRYGNEGLFSGNSLYVGGPGTNPGRAYKVSYNRPLTTRGTTLEDAPFAAEFPMIRWLERNGYDVSYFTGIDADRSGDKILDHRAYLSVGHDEYWSADQRANVEAARDAGVNLAFFSGNEIFWKTRWEDSIDGSDTDHRTLVSYKETHANARIDPEPGVWTGTWRDPRFSAETDGGQPENALTGTIFTVNSGTAAIKVPAADGKMRLWRDTSVASLEPGETATLSDGTLGYEWDEDLDNGFRPAGLMRLSSTTVDVPEHLLDYGSNYGPATATHHLTMYRADSGALVFGAGTVQWSWGLDGVHDRGGSIPDPRMQQATVNLLADMGAQPGSLQLDLDPATKSIDTTAPTTAISSPVANAEVENGKPLTVSGTASDAAGEGGGGQVAAVEVSTDGGDTWHPADGRDEWSYKWKPKQIGAVTILARSSDDSGNLGDPDEVEVNVVPRSCPCSIWEDSFTGPEDPDGGSIEVGVKFRADVDGFITGLRFYKSPGNSGTHTGRLWTGNGTLLTTAKFTNESGSGWQEVAFEDPVAIKANTTYVASYYAPNGHYAGRSNYFNLVGEDNAPLHALADGVDGPNGIFRHGGPGELFSEGGPQSFGSANYLVDVVFQQTIPPDNDPPAVVSTVPADGATELSVGTSLRFNFSEPIKTSSITSATVTLRDPEGNAVPAALSYEPEFRRVNLNPQEPLRYSSTYTAVVKGGPGGVSDRAGNPLPADATSSFTTESPAPPPPDSGPGGPILVITNTSNLFSSYYAEILRAEGLNAFRVTDLSNVTPSLLGSYDVAILGESALTVAQEQMLDNWVQGGGNLIAMRPDPGLATLLGITPGGGTLGNAYIKVDTTSGPGAGIVDQTIQFHGSADRYTATGAQTIASLYGTAGGPATSNPAVTLRSVGPNGGQAAAFTYDLAKSVIYTRQGNRAWAGEERDGVGPVRPDDLFFGSKPGDEQPDWADLNKVQIPQADEQQRLLTNLIESMNIDRKPLPRFWFLPRDEKAAIVMTGDDHGTGGTVGRFEQYEEDSPPGCVVANWECIRATAYVYPNTPITDAHAASFNAAGFEIGLHVLTGCEDWLDQAHLESIYSSELNSFANSFPSLPAPVTERTHCIVWSDWASQPKVEQANGVRLDTNYYYWPGSWVQNRPGMFTGSGMPMRFANLDGSMIDVYQAATQMTDESVQTYPFTVDTLLDNALGPQGYYGVFTANIHTDFAQMPESDAIVQSAQERGVPIVSARQMLTWLDGRNGSSFSGLTWTGGHLSFGISPGPGSNGLRAMLPVKSDEGDLETLTHEGNPVAFSLETIKGIEYALFDAAAGSYVATFDTTAPETSIDSSPPALTNAASASFAFSGTDAGGSGIASFECRRDGAAFAPCTSPQAYAALADGAHSFEVRAIDAAGNADQTPATFTWTIDTAAPNTTIDSSPPALTNAGSANFAFSGTDAGGSGVASFECRRDGASFTPCTSPQAYASLADGAHTFEVRAIDTAGNADQTPASFSWSIDTAAPETSINSSPPALTNAASASFAFSGTDAGGSGIASFECRIDSTQAADWGSCSSPKSYSNLSDGAHSFEVRAIDAAGNVDQTPASFSWSIDTAAPTTNIDSSPPALSGSPLRQLRLLGDRRRRLRRRLVRMPDRLDPGRGLGELQLAEELLKPERRRPYVRSPGDRSPPATSTRPRPPSAGRSTPPRRPPTSTRARRR